MDKRSALLQNTTRMKKLQRLIEMQNEAKLKHEKRKEKKHLKKELKKKKRERRVSASSSSSESSENSEDDVILKKFVNILRKVDEVKNGGSQLTVEKSEEKKSKKRHHHHRHHQHRHSKTKNNSRSPRIASISSFDPSDSAQRHGSRSSSKKVLEPPYSRDRGYDNSRQRSRSRSFGVARRRYMPSTLPTNPPRSQRSSSRSRCRGESKRKLTQEEMAALREQMAADAKERESERQSRFFQHQNEKAKEEQEEGQARASHGASFLRGLTLSHVASASVEEVVQRNVNKRQKGGMDQNFLRR